MKNLVYVVIFLCCLNLSAQTWAPLGAKWNYQLANLIYGGSEQIKRAGDTVINGKNCVVLSRITQYIGRPYNGHVEIKTYPGGKIFMYEENGAVYWYTLDSFYKLYDFNARLGDTMYFHAPFFGSSQDCKDHGQMVVSDTGSEYIGGMRLRYYSMTLLDTAGWGIEGRIYERMGPMSYMFPQPIGKYCYAGDGDYMGPLRCYIDDKFIREGQRPEDCELISGLREKSKQSFSISLYPNPAQDKLYLSGIPSGADLKTSIYDLTGRIVLSKSKPATGAACIDITGIPAGVYFLQINSGAHAPEVLRFVKIGNR